MNYYIESSSTDPSFNLALEQYVFDCMDRAHSYFMLWQNHNSVIVGKHQNTIAEINSAFVNANNISVVRRLSGGGAVYHDLGNLNFTFITGAGSDNSIDFSGFCEPVQKALVSLGVPAVLSGRNDITVDGKKVSGNAQYVKQSRVMHHGTLLYDSNLDVLSQVLNAKGDKIESKGIKSVRSRVTNIRPYMKNDMSVNDFMTALKNHLFNVFNLTEYIISDSEIKEIEKIKKETYSRWSWNYGESPAYNIRKSRYIEGCGNIEVLLDVEKGGIINNIAFFGDFFGADDPRDLAVKITGRHYEYNEIEKILKDIDLTRFFLNIDVNAFLAVLFE